ncbi:MAG: InlB B-repeat-containing protein, partial [Clostridia bacterium]|nr:InlB B-repeat-containing protein [Clostridia bacterium]
MTTSRAYTVRRAVSAVLAFVLLFVSLPILRANGAGDSSDRPWLWPVPGSYKINSLDYYYGGGFHNRGQCIDIGCNGYSEAERLDIISATDGTVVYIQNKYNEETNRGSGLGNYVIVQSGDICLVYGHLKTVTCGYGEIKAGSVLGKMGRTGTATGVHLHMQAYPASESLNSTSIHVFDRYQYNPLYVEKFQFMKGLKTYSVRYGELIGQYYTRSSGAYFAYSGGLAVSYETDPVSATVTVINAGGAVVRSRPLADNSHNMDTYPNGSQVAVAGIHTDAYGAKWLLTEEGGYWLSFDDVGFNSYRFGCEIVNGETPFGLYGSIRDLPLSGMVLSRNKMVSYTATLMQEDTTLATYSRAVNATSFELGAYVIEGFELSSLADGGYTFIVTVREEASYPGADTASRDVDIITADFFITSDVKDNTPPFVEAVHITSLTEKGLTLRCIATDDRAVEKVMVGVVSDDYSVANIYDAVLQDGDYIITVDRRDMMVPGPYNVTATAYDYYGNIHSTSITVELPSSELAERWIVVEGPLRVRTGPGASYSKVTTLSVGTEFSVSEIVTADGYTWGKTDNGWCALEYCSKVSGSLYTVTFDLNGGSSGAPAPLTLPYGGSVTIPAAVPVREGCTFLGWSHSSGAVTADYVAGSPYTQNVSATLFAVWSDHTPPVISSVTKSPESGWTKENVIVTVTAADNSGIVFYSFDGGRSWRGEGVYAAHVNGELAAGQILLKDSFGNTAAYPSAVSISNVDKTAPRVKDGIASVTVNGSAATFTFSGMTDNLSGIARYEVVLSPTADFASPSVTEVTSGQTLQLNNG